MVKQLWNNQRQSFVTLIKMQLHGVQTVAHQPKRHLRIRAELVLNQTIDITRS